MTLEHLLIAFPSCVLGLLGVFLGLSLFESARSDQVRRLDFALWIHSTRAVAEGWVGFKERSDARFAFCWRLRHALDAAKVTPWWTRLPREHRAALAEIEEWSDK